MTKQTVNAYVSRIYKACRDENLVVIVKKMYGLTGLAENKRVTLDHRKDLLPTFIHEMLHVIYPTWSESKVLKHEYKIVNKLSPIQVRRMLGLIVQLLELNKDEV